MLELLTLLSTADARRFDQVQQTPNCFLYTFTAGQQPMPVSASHARAGGFFWVLSPNRHKPHFGRVLFGFEGIIWVRGYYLVYLGRNPVQLREPELLRGTSRATKPVRSKLGKHNKNSYTICIFMTKLIFSVTPHRTVAELDRTHSHNHQCRCWYNFYSRTRNVPTRSTFKT